MSQGTRITTTTTTTTTTTPLVVSSLLLLLLLNNNTLSTTEAFFSPTTSTNTPPFRISSSSSSTGKRFKAPSYTKDSTSTTKLYAASAKYSRSNNKQSSNTGTIWKISNSTIAVDVVNNNNNNNNDKSLLYPDELLFDESLLRLQYQEYIQLEQAIQLSTTHHHHHHADSTILPSSTTDAIAAVDVVDVTDSEQQQQQQQSVITTSSSNKDIWTARALLIGAAALYGTNFAFVKLMGTDIPVGLSTTLRFGLAAASTMPWLISTKLFDRTSEEFAATIAGLEVGLWNSIGYVAQAVGLETTLASKSAFLCSLAVVVVPLLDWMYGKKLKGREMLGLVMALAGVAFLELNDIIRESAFEINSGDIASFIQPFAFGIGFWKMEKAMHKYTNHANRTTAAQLLAIFAVSAIYMAMTSDMSNILNYVNLYDPILWCTLFYTGCITTALTIYMETIALKTLSAAETTLIFSTEPVWGSLTAALVLNETFGIPAIIGGLFVLSGCITSNLGMNGLQKFFMTMKTTKTTEMKSKY